jgi:YD repeat-containing protein
MLSKVKRLDAAEVTFKYDALGRRIEKGFNNRIHMKWVWDGNVPLHEWREIHTKDYEPEKAMSPGQVKPGGWATTDHITDVTFVREKLAVTPEFKPEISHVQKYHIPEGVQVQVGKVGPQTHNGITYPGGGNQVQILNFEDRAKLQPIGEPKIL